MEGITGFTKKAAAFLLSFGLALALCPAVALAAPSTGGLSAADVGAQAQGGRALLPQAAPIFKGVKAAKVYTHSKRPNNGGAHVAKVNGATFKTTKTNSSRYYFAYTLQVTYKGKTKTIDADVDYSFVTNGRYVVYAKGMTPVTMHSGGSSYSAYKSNIYRVDLRTGAKKRIAAGNDWVVHGANGSYAYCGGRCSSVVSSSTYAINVKTRARKKLVSPSPAQLESANGRVAYTTLRLQLCSSTLYVAKASGAGKKKVADMVDNFRISGKRIIYLQGKLSNGSMYFRVARCSLTGGSKTALTGWKKESYPNSPYSALLKKYKLEVR